MKDQYFGDNKDLFTYDLIYRVMQTGLVGQFTFIPMLTPPDNTGQGGKTDRNRARVGAHNKELVSFLDDSIRQNRRDIKQLEEYFAGHGIKMAVYSGADKYFSHRQRREYFAQIGDDLLTKSLIFVAPDVGLEVVRSGEKHLLLGEVQDLYRRMGEHSILMLFQHFPREDHHEYLHRRAEELAENVTGQNPICIDDNEVIFFFLTRNDELEHSISHLIEQYAESYA
ncbi:MAG: hypothetical protein QGI51_05565 [Dehalococcoidales bacterium]|jgi:hypothetical protein|nr:hypothetical protein [Dehalococcoidales bacterium]